MHPSITSYTLRAYNATDLIILTWPPPCFRSCTFSYRTKPSSKASTLIHYTVLALISFLHALTHTHHRLTFIGSIRGCRAVIGTRTIYTTCNTVEWTGTYFYYYMLLCVPVSSYSLLYIYTPDSSTICGIKMIQTKLAKSLPYRQYRSIQMQTHKLLLVNPYNHHAKIFETLFLQDLAKIIHDCV